VTRPRAGTIQELQKDKNIARENLALMQRLVNASKSVNFKKFEADFKKHKHAVKNLGKHTRQVSPATKQQTNDQDAIEPGFVLIKANSHQILP
jgi:hypothetical protein